MEWISEALFMLYENRELHFEKQFDCEPEQTKNPPGGRVKEGPNDNELFPTNFYTAQSGFNFHFNFPIG